MSAVGVGDYVAMRRTGRLGMVERLLIQRSGSIQARVTWDSHHTGSETGWSRPVSGLVSAVDLIVVMSAADIAADVKAEAAYERRSV